MSGGPGLFPPLPSTICVLGFTTIPVMSLFHSIPTQVLNDSLTCLHSPPSDLLAKAAMLESHFDLKNTILQKVWDVPTRSLLAPQKAAGCAQHSHWGRARAVHLAGGPACLQVGWDLWQRRNLSELVLGHFPSVLDEFKSMRAILWIFHSPQLPVVNDCRRVNHPFTAGATEPGYGYRRITQSRRKPFYLLLACRAQIRFDRMKNLNKDGQESRFLNKYSWNWQKSHPSTVQESSSALSAFEGQMYYLRLLKIDTETNQVSSLVHFALFVCLGMVTFTIRFKCSPFPWASHVKHPLFSFHVLVMLNEVSSDFFFQTDSPDVFISAWSKIT